jgi:membrane fusion protein (multidrug efflux system)
VPVKIALDPRSALLGRLRPGMSVEASIDTRAEGRAVAATNLVGDAEAAQQ